MPALKMRVRAVLRCLGGAADGAVVGASVGAEFVAGFAVKFNGLSKSSPEVSILLLVKESNIRVAAGFRFG